MAIAIGIPAAIWCSLGYRHWRQVPLSSRLTLLVLALVNLTGRNMGEVARLWMLFIPPLLLACRRRDRPLRRAPDRSGRNGGASRGADTGAGGLDPGRLPGVRSQTKTLVTLTPRSVSICTSSPRATSRPFDVSSTGARLWRPSSTTSPGLSSGKLRDRQIDTARARP